MEGVCVRVGPEMHVGKQEGGTGKVLNGNTETVSKVKIGAKNN